MFRTRRVMKAKASMYSISCRRRTGYFEPQRKKKKQVPRGKATRDVAKTSSRLRTRLS